MVLKLTLLSSCQITYMELFSNSTKNQSTATRKLFGMFTFASSNSHSASLGVIIGQFKRAVTITQQIASSTKPPEQPIWQRNFYEHIIRNERSLDDIREYIYENPARWLEDSLYVQ